MSSSQLLELPSRTVSIALRLANLALSLPQPLSNTSMARSKIRWGDTLDDEEALPPTTVKGPDSHGIKITTEYYKNDKGEAIKKVTKLKVVHVEKKVYKVQWVTQCSGGNGA